MVSPADKAHAVRAAGEIALNFGFILAITKFTQHYLVRTRDAISRNIESRRE
ncbi:hypothetical protein RchiOBHm_Chr5g0009171 [Rosa chinensis]|uniref:Uncharacterized protein n=1 Tax=Rosa chinensis TaxID=74649 RepID=A0A2P6Q490_ROSCH|nr:hypothetical protein RchiOBHm_Chr5g0009171 [Rosa chinensis]